MFSRLVLVLCCTIAIVGCAPSPKGVLPTGSQAYQLIPAPDPTRPEPLYRLNIGDKISVSVFQEPELSVETAVIDEAGNVQLPLIGQVRAAGLTATELSDAVARLLAARYLREPKVVVGVSERFQQVVAVEGQVNEPGVFPIDRSYTLLTSLARAKSTTKTARLSEVVVFRTINGQRMGAVFNLGDIRAGRAPDPQIVGGDVIVVGFSEVKGAFRDFLQMAPLFNVFTQF